MKAVKQGGDFLPQFKARTFVAEGYEDCAGSWCEIDRHALRKLRMDYPELSHWGDLALGCAFDDYSRDVLHCGWADWIVGYRTESFLNYCYWRQTKGLAMDSLDESLEKCDGWKAWLAEAEVLMAPRAA